MGDMHLARVPSARPCTTRHPIDYLRRRDTCPKKVRIRDYTIKDRRSLMEFLEYRVIGTEFCPWNFKRSSPALHFQSIYILLLALAKGLRLSGVKENWKHKCSNNPGFNGFGNIVFFPHDLHSLWKISTWLVWFHPNSPLILLLVLLNKCIESIFYNWQCQWPRNSIHNQHFSFREVLLSANSKPIVFKKVSMILILVANNVA